MKVKKICLIILLIAILVCAGVVIKISIDKKGNVVDTSNQNESVTDETTDQEDDTNDIKRKIDLEIKDDYFSTQMNDIYFNYRQYAGKIVSYEGFVYYEDEDPNYANYEGELNHNLGIVRYFYCCGYDASVTGLECKYNGDKLKQGDWYKVTGVIKINEDNQSDIFPYLDITSLEKMETPGNEYVYS